MFFTACENGFDDGNDSEISDPYNPLNKCKCASNEILYMTKSCTPIELERFDGWGANLTSNTYGKDGVGRLKFDAVITKIPYYAFEDNDLLTYIKMPNSVTAIGEDAFYSCNSLTSVTIPNSVTAIREGAFRFCNGLTAFYGKFASADNRCLIVDGVLEWFAPAGLTKYTIPNSVTTIGEYTFQSCKNLTSVTIPNSVTTIGRAAFFDCDNLTSVTIPNSVTAIGEDAFYSCNSLTSVYCKPTTPPSLGNYDIFQDAASELTIYVPTASVEAYKSASGWKEYYIEGYDF